MKQELPLRYEELMRVRKPAALINAIDRAAHRDLLSRSGYIRQAVIARLRADGVKLEEIQAAGGIEDGRERPKTPRLEDQAFLDLGAREGIPRHISGKSGSPEPHTRQ